MKFTDGMIFVSERLALAPMKAPKSVTKGYTGTGTYLMIFDIEEELWGEMVTRTRK
jgi:hypothetical protein